MENSNEERRRYSGEQKFKIVKEALTSGTSVTEVCRKYGVHTGLFYKWQERFLSGALERLRQAEAGATKAELRKIEELQKDNDRMKSVIAEIIVENIDFKKKYLA